MDLTAKKYKIEKTKKFIKQNRLFIFFNGINRNSTDWVIIEQDLQKINFNYYKIFNKTSKLALNDSIFLSIISLINSVTFLLKPLKTENNLHKKILFQKFESLGFLFNAIKINNKIYSKSQIKNLVTLNYKDNKLMFYKFLIANVKVNLK